MWRPELRATAFAMLVAACGAPEASAPEPTASAPPSSAASSVRVPSAVERRLEGAWEVTGFRPKNPIPDEAGPIVRRLFGAMRLQFDAGRMSVSVAGDREERAFSISDEQGDTFRLRVPGGMFDGAWGRFLADGTLELVDEGNPWPGVSTLRPLAQR